jgi:integrase
MPRPLKPRPKPPKNQNPDPGIRWLEARGCWYIDVSAFGIRRTKTKPTLEHARQWKAWATTTPPESKVEKAALTVSDWIEHFLENIEHTASVDPINALAPRTRAGYAEKLERYVKPYIGLETLEDLTPLKIEKWVRTVQTKHTINAAWEAHRRFKGCLTMAVKRGVIPSNPCQYTNPPKGSADPTKCFSAAPSRWTNDEVTLVLETLETKAHARSPIKNMMMVWLATGLRKQEVFGLRWKDVDLDAKIITVRNTVTSVDGKQQSREKTKTGKIRVVPFDDYALAALNAQAQRCADLEAVSDGVWFQMGLVFPSEQGAAFPITTFTKWYSRLCTDAGVTRIRPYDIRSTYGSALHFNWDMDEQVAASRLGHSVHVYRETYVRPLEAERNEGVIPTKDLYSAQTKRRQNDLGRQNLETLKSKNHTD